MFKLCSQCSDSKEYSRAYRDANPVYVKEWKIQNKERINRRERNRRATDVHFKLKKNVSRAISHAIFKNGQSTIKYLPYTIGDLKSHLEKRFDSKMSWENYGTYWHIDHIVPHSLFKYSSMQDEEFIKCWSLGNLRPLEASQNKVEGASRIRHKRV